MFTVDEIASVISASPNPASGVYARFVKLDDKWGFKFFRDMDSRDQAYNNQKRGYEIGYAPAVGESLDVVIDGRRHYGYVTQVAISASQEFFDKHNVTEDGYRYKWSESLRDEWAEENDDKTSSPEFRAMIGAYHNAGLYPYDLHMFNWGYLPNGQMVIMDFGW